jgi:putative ABC transport system permease protein
MREVVLRGFFSRKLRVALTGVAVALGVALMSGTYILTDTINQSFATIFASGAAGRSVVVVPHQGLGANAAVQTAPIGDATLARVRAVPGVAVASGEIFSIVSLFDAHGKRLNSRAPSFVASTLPARFENFSAVSGTLPASSIDVAVDQAAAQRDSLKVGQTLRVAGAGASRIYRIAGIVKFAGSPSFGGAGVALVTPSQAQYIAGEPGQWDELVVAATPSVSSNVLRARIRAVLPPTLDVRTGLQQAAKQTSDLESQLGFLRTFLLIFAYVSLFVGAFIIFNTFSITVAQRTREFGLLRTLGATRGQVVRSVVAEGVMLGLGGAAVGLLAGIGLAPALDQLFKAFGADLPDSGTVIAFRTVWVSLLAGTAVTVIAGLLPALRAARVTPIAAMREGVPLERNTRTRRRRQVAFAVIAVLVVLRVVLSAASGAGVVTILVIVAIVVGVRVPHVRARVRAVFLAAVVGLAHLLGRPLAWRGITARLARDNTIRHPGRTAVTAAALMIGLALVSFVSILAAGTKASINKAIDASFAGNLIVQNSSAAGNQGIPADIPAALRRIHGVQQVTAVAFTEGKVTVVGKTTALKGTQPITAVDPVSFTRMYRIDWDHGSDAVLDALGSSGTVVKNTFASANHIKVGSELSVQTPSGRRISLRVRGIVVDNAGLLTDLTITLPLARSAFSQRTDALDFVGYAPGVGNAQVQPAVDRLLSARFPQAESQTAAQFKASLASQVNSFLALIYVLLALSVIVSLFGIVNTLVLSIFERTRELGMLRAIGTSRRQVRQMIRYEALITALIGGVLGIALGIVLALILSATVLSGSGFVLVIPVVTMIVLFVLAGVAGLAAAAWPARRAAKVDILAAIATQ